MSIGIRAVSISCRNFLFGSAKSLPAVSSNIRMRLTPSMASQILATLAASNTPFLSQSNAVRSDVEFGTSAGPFGMGSVPVQEQPPASFNENIQSLIKASAATASESLITLNDELLRSLFYANLIEDS